ncbi:conserved hypothetical protein [Ricinus communis]|uniref:Uncharacterized protein n=1 Tax=Ricinus communis TaxID=3988 RepID=B9T551_RICCO|nr:conserved hypothetical protein [Ricinus communis]
MDKQRLNGMTLLGHVLDDMVILLRPVGSSGNNHVWNCGNNMELVKLNPQFHRLSKGQVLRLLGSKMNSGTWSCLGSFTSSFAEKK